MSVHSYEFRGAIVRRLETIRNHSTDTTRAVRSAAQQAGVTERTVWRWLENPRPTPKRERLGLDRDALVAIARHHGNRKAAWRYLRTEGKFDLTYSQFARRLDSMPTDVVAGVVDGMSAALKRSLYNQAKNPAKLEVLSFDHTEMPLWCVRPETGERIHPWLTLLLDWGTRLLLAVVLTEGEGVGGDPNTASIIAGISTALVGHDLDGTWVGGRPSVMVADNAQTHLAQAVLNGYAALAIQPHFIHPASPWENGKVERLMLTVEREFIATLPGYTHHGDRRYSREAWAPTDYLTVDAVAEALRKWVAHYNSSRPHAGLNGRTPLQAWRDDPTIVEVVDEALVRGAFLIEARLRRVSKNGVHFRGVDYQSPSLRGQVGRDVAIRYLPNDRSRIDIWQRGEFLCTAMPAKDISVEQRAEITRVRSRTVGQISRIQKRSVARTLETLSGSVSGPMRRPRLVGQASEDAAERYLQRAQAAMSRRKATGRFQPDDSHDVESATA